MNYESGIMNQESEGTTKEPACQPTEEICDQKIYRGQTPVKLTEVCPRI